METEQSKTNEVKEKTEELEELKVKCEEYLNGWKRAKADFINYQKDEVKRFTEIIQFANEAIVKDLLVVLDSFRLAFVSHQSDLSSHSESFNILQYKLRE